MIKAPRQLRDFILPISNKFSGNLMAQVSVMETELNSKITKLLGQVTTS